MVLLGEAEISVSNIQGFVKILFVLLLSVIVNFGDLMNCLMRFTRYVVEDHSE